jgi:hypothetical protein
MNSEQTALWREGQILWQEYINANGYSWTYNNKGISKLSRLLDLKPKYIRQRLCVYLDN